MTTDGSGQEQDDALVAELRAVVRQVDPVPASVLEAARAAFVLRDLDAAMATLVADSRDEGLAGVRGEAAPRLLTWAWRDLTLDVELRPSGARRSLVGQLVGPAVRSLVVQSAHRSEEVDVDDLGRFQAVPAAGPLRLRVQLADRTVVTPWVLV